MSHKEECACSKVESLSGYSSGCWCIRMQGIRAPKGGVPIGKISTRQLLARVLLSGLEKVHPLSTRGHHFEGSSCFSRDGSGTPVRKPSLVSRAYP